MIPEQMLFLVIERTAKIQSIFACRKLTMGDFGIFKENIIKPCLPLTENGL